MLVSVELGANDEVVAQLGKRLSLFDLLLAIEAHHVPVLTDEVVVEDDVRHLCRQQELFVACEGRQLLLLLLV